MEYLLIVNDLEKKNILKKISSKQEIVNIKVLGYREFIKKMYFDYSDETIVYIMEKYKVQEEIAKIYIQSLYLLEEQNSNIPKIKFLTNLYQELLDKKLLVINHLWKEKIKTSKIIFYHLDYKDKFFQKILLKCQKITKTEVIGSETKFNAKVIKTDFNTMEEEVIAICNKICNLLKNGKKESEMFLSNLTETYRNLFLIYAPMFHLNLNLQKKEGYFSSQIISSFLDFYEEDLNITLKKLREIYSKDADIEVINWIVSICNRYVFIKNPEIKKRMILNKLKTEKKKTGYVFNGIKEIDFFENEISDNSLLFVLGTTEGAFPKIKKDEGFLNDREMVELGLNTTRELNELEKERCLIKLKSFANIYMSCPKKDGKIELYPSSILENINYQKQLAEKDYSNSHQFNRISLAQKLDDVRKFGMISQDLNALKSTYPNIEYNNFQNHYTKVETFRDKISLSYSSLDNFFRCAFRYYLNNVLHLNIYEKTLEQEVGNLFHIILKESYENNFSFEESWEKYVKEIDVKSASEKFFLNKLKKDLLRVIETLQVQEQGKDFRVKTEEKVTLEMNINPQVELVGIMDKIFWKEKENSTLISIVDYKTGNPNLNLNEMIYGIGLQLPIYLLLIHKLPFQNIKIIGFYMQKILPSIPERDKVHSEEELKMKKLKLQGYSTNEESVLKEFDSTYENSNLIAGMKTSSKGFYSYSKVLSPEQMKKIEEITKRKIEEAVNAIEKNMFDINPKRIAGQLIGCEYCPFQEICYRTESNIIDLPEQKANDFLGGDRNADMDQ